MAIGSLDVSTTAKVEKSMKRKQKDELSKEKRSSQLQSGNVFYGCGSFSIEEDGNTTLESLDPDYDASCKTDIIDNEQKLNLSPS